MARKISAVLAPIEVALLDLVGDALPGVVVLHEAAEQGLFGLDAVRRDAERLRLVA